MIMELIAGIKCTGRSVTQVAVTSRHRSSLVVLTPVFRLRVVISRPLLVIMTKSNAALGFASAPRYSQVARSVNRRGSKDLSLLIYLAVSLCWSEHPGGK